MTLRRPVLAAAIALAFAAPALAAPPIPPAPVAPVQPVTDTYFGVQVTDPYRWMEDRHAPKFLEWAKAENDHARATLAAIPGREALQARIAAHTAAGVSITAVSTAGGRIFYEKREPGQDTYKLFVRDGVSGPERILVDPDKAATAGHHFAIDYYQPSHDGRRIAYAVSPGGSEESVIHVLDVDDGKEAPETIDRAEAGSPGWLPGGKAFFYNRYVKLGAGAAETDKYLNSAVFLHVVGTDPETDTPLIGPAIKSAVADAPVDTPIIATAPGSPWALAIVTHGDLPAVTMYVAPADKVTGADAPWRKVADIDDAVTDFALSGSRLFLLTHKDAPRFKIVEVDAANPDIAHAKLRVEASNRVIQGLSVASDVLYVRDLDAGLGKLRRYELSSNTMSDVVLPIQGSVTLPVADPTSSTVLFSEQGWLNPVRWFQIRDNARTEAQLAAPWKEDTSAYTAIETQAIAPDGTAIPLSIIHKKGLAISGKNPTWLVGYGAYGISLEPSFVGKFIPFLEDGGVVAIAHVRGGGEFGEDWHQGGRLLNKPNTYKDFIACAEYLVKHRYTSPSHLAIQGGSAGGITVGMALTTRPDLFRVVFSDVGDSNALRAEYETDGAANAVEYGSLADETGFKSLASVDALSHVKDGTPYPAVMLTTGINDPRVAPWQPGKFTARLQAATSSGRPVILRVDYDAGHGIGSTKSQRDAVLADQMAFLYWQIGKAAYQPGK